MNDKLAVGAAAAALAGAALKLATRQRSSGAAMSARHLERVGNAVLTSAMIDALVHFPERLYGISVPPHARVQLEQALRAAWHARDARHIATTQQVCAYATHYLSSVRANPAVEPALRAQAHRWLPYWQVETAIDSPYSLWLFGVMRPGASGGRGASRAGAGEQALRASRSAAKQQMAAQRRAASLEHLPPTNIGPFIG
jgi:hypothetical protein